MIRLILFLSLLGLTSCTTSFKETDMSIIGGVWWSIAPERCNQVTSEQVEQYSEKLKFKIDDYLAKHSVSEKIRTALTVWESVIPGMDKEQTLLLLGKPSKEVLSKEGQECWSYSAHCGSFYEYLICFEEGIVTQIFERHSGDVL